MFRSGITYAATRLAAALAAAVLILGHPTLVCSCAAEAATHPAAQRPHAGCFCLQKCGTTAGACACTSGDHKSASDRFCGCQAPRAQIASNGSRAEEPRASFEFLPAF